MQILDPHDRDIVIRTILGEAAGEGPQGQAAVAHVVKNRMHDPRWPSYAADVALQPKQFSAWNKGAGGNHLVNKYGPGSDPYEDVGNIVDGVWSGDIFDPTGGATHYYSPAGMEQLVAEGSQTNLLPRWLDAEASRSGGMTTIGGHNFVGSAEGVPPPFESPGFHDYISGMFVTPETSVPDSSRFAPNLNFSGNPFMLGSEQFTAPMRVPTSEDRSRAINRTAAPSLNPGMVQPIDSLLSASLNSPMGGLLGQMGLFNNFFPSAPSPMNQFPQAPLNSFGQGLLGQSPQFNSAMASGGLGLF